MKKIIYTSIGILLLSASTLLAQPLPPSTPSGSPVPASGFIALLPLAMLALGYVKLRKKKLD